MKRINMSKDAVGYIGSIHLRKIRDRVEGGGGEHELFVKNHVFPQV